MTKSRLSLLLLIPVIALVLSSCNGDVIRSIQLTNEARKAAGVAVVYSDDTLENKAQAWADHLASKGTLTHSNLWDGAGSGWRALGENLAMAGSVDEAHRLLMNSPSHRSTMLSGKYNRVGIGVAYSGNRIFVVQVFGTR